MGRTSQGGERPGGQNQACPPLSSHASEPMLAVAGIWASAGSQAAYNQWVPDRKRQGREPWEKPRQREGKGGRAEGKRAKPQSPPPRLRPCCSPACLGEGENDGLFPGQSKRGLQPRNGLWGHPRFLQSFSRLALDALCAPDTPVPTCSPSRGPLRPPRFLGPPRPRLITTGEGKSPPADLRPTRGASPPHNPPYSLPVGERRGPASLKRQRRPAAE